MRRIKEEELLSLSQFMIEQFFEKEEMQTLFAGIDPIKAKQLAVELVYFDLSYFYKYGDVFIYDDEITGAVVGMPSKKMSFLKRLPYVVKANKKLSILSKEEWAQLKKNAKEVNEVHSQKWFKKYCKNPYYFLQFGIAKEKRGQGIAREMLEDLFSFAKQNHDNIVVETLSPSNVSIYEHFGFEQKENVHSKNGTLSEYRFIKNLKETD